MSRLLKPLQMQNQKSLVLATELKNKEGETIVVPIHLSVEKNGYVKIINRIPSTYGKHSFKRWFDEGALLGYDKEKGPAFLSSEHRSNSRSPRISPIDQTPTANDKKANPFAKVIVYQNDASVGDFYQKSISPVFNQAAYHGTAYTFDKFTLDHVGSGEGVQAHGWGLYFSLDRQIAEGYRSRVTSYRSVADELSRVFAGMDIKTREGMAKALALSNVLTASMRLRAPTTRSRENHPDSEGRHFHFCS